MAVKKAVPQTYKNLWPLPATTVLVSCVGTSNIPNIITIGACGVVSVHPPLLSLAIGVRQDSFERRNPNFSALLFIYGILAPGAL